MAKTAQERLAEVKQQQSAQDRLAEIEGQPAPQGGDSILGILSKNIAQPFNEGLLSIPELLPGGDDLRATADQWGMTQPEGQGADNAVADTMEILGGSVLPAGGLATAGRQLVTQVGKTVAPAVRGPMQEFMVQASKPGSILGEVLAAIGAGPGGQIAEGISDSPNAKVSGQLVGGMTPAGVTMAAKPALQGGKFLAGKVADLVEKIPLMGTTVRVGRDVAEGVAGTLNPHYRAAREVQKRVVDPEQAAGKLDTESPMPSARQIGEDRLLRLDENLRSRSSPAAVEQSEKHIEAAVDAARKQAVDVGGDVNAPRQMVQQQALKTVREAEEALVKVEPGTSRGDLSESARMKLDDAQKAARSAESAAWKEVGFESKGGYDNTMSAVSEILDETGRATKGVAVPQQIWDEIRAAGFRLNKNGEWVLTKAAKKKMPETTLKDIHSLRQVVQGQKGAAQLDPEKRGLVRWLSKLEDSLLADMESVAGDANAIKAARKTTKEFYDMFRRGKMGQVLGYAERSRQAVAPRDTLDRVFSGTESTRDVEQMVNAAPETKTEAANYVRAMFMDGAVRDGKVSQTLAKGVMRKLENKRIFEMFPELKDEFADAITKGELGDALKLQGEVLPRGSKKSLAAMFLDEMPGEETDLLLNVAKTRNPAQRARQLLARMNNNPKAEDGLRQSFRESMWRSGMVVRDGVKRPSAAKFTEVVNNHIETMRALKFPEDQINDMKRLSKLMREAKAKPTGKDSDDTLTDIPGIILNRASRVLGAHMGAWMNRILGGTGAGTSLQAAQMGASTTAQVSGALRADPAERILLDAMDDPSLMKALLLRDGAPTAAKKKAAERLNAWAVGVGLTQDEESEP